MSSTLYAQLADALRENAANREAIEQQDALILHQSDEITQLHAHVAEQADYIATLEQHFVKAQRDLDRSRENYTRLRDAMILGARAEGNKAGMKEFLAIWEEENA